MYIKVRNECVDKERDGKTLLSTYLKSRLHNSVTSLKKKIIKKQFPKTN